MKTFDESQIQFIAFFAKCSLSQRLSDVRVFVFVSRFNSQSVNMISWFACGEMITVLRMTFDNLMDFFCSIPSDMFSLFAFQKTNSIEARDSLTTRLSEDCVTIFNATRNYRYGSQPKGAAWFASGFLLKSGKFPKNFLNLDSLQCYYILKQKTMAIASKNRWCSYFKIIRNYIEACNIRFRDFKN